MRKDNPSDSKLRNEAMNRIRSDKIQAAQLSLSGVQGNTDVARERERLHLIDLDIKRDEASRKEARDVSEALDKEYNSPVAKGEARAYQKLLQDGKFIEAQAMKDAALQHRVDVRRGATRKAISSDETVAPVVNPPPIATKLPKDVTVTRNK